MITVSNRVGGVAAEMDIYIPKRLRDRDDVILVVTSTTGRVCMHGAHNLFLFFFKKIIYIYIFPVKASVEICMIEIKVIP